MGALPVDIKAGDIDGNGTLDLVTANRDGDSISVLRNNGTAVFTVQTLAAGLEPRSVALGDLNNNGTLDAVVSLHDADSVATFLNTGGVFSAPVSTPVAGGQSPEGIAIADVNNDGFKDVLYTIGNDLNLGQNFVGLFNGNGSGVLTTSRLFPTNGLDSSRMVAADFNVDGFADIAVTNESGSTVSVLIGSAAGLSAPTLLNVGTHPDGIIAADLNADGRFDIATSNRDSHNTSVILSIFCLADFNSDGVVDFADDLDFLNLFASSSAGADVNRDGTIDFFDYLDFVAAFSAGC